MTDLNRLKAQRGQLKARLTKAQKYYDELDQANVDLRTFTELKVRLGKLEPLLDKFNEIQAEIEIAEQSNDDGVYNEQLEEEQRSTFEDNYYAVVRDYETTISMYHESQNVQAIPSPAPSEYSSPINQSPINQSIKLPTISLPKFNGDFKAWVEFRDSFSALVHSNSGLSDIQRFYYLKSSLGEKASQIIDNLQVSAENYTIAWELLSERFEQKGLIIHSHLNTIFEYPIMQKESHSELRNLYDTITKNLRSLKALGQPIDQWDCMVIYIITSKMDPKTRKEWELYEKSSSIPTMEDINKFLKQRCEVLEKLAVTSTIDNKKEKYNTIKNKSQSHAYVSNNNNSSSNYNMSRGPECYNCKGQHTIFKCETFLKNTPQERITSVKRNKLCYNCLRPSHTLQDCTFSSCTKCGLRHNSLLHTERVKNNQTQNNHNQTSNNIQSQSNNTITRDDNNPRVENQSVSVIHSLNLVSEQNNQSNSQLSGVTQVLLSTAIIKVKDNRGNYHMCRALLDSGSMSNFVTENLCEKLNLPKNNVNFSILGVGQSTTSVNSYTNINFQSNNNAYNATVQCLVLPKITENLPMFSFNKSNLKIPHNIRLADPQFNKTGSIDILLGSSIFWQLLSIGQINLPGTKLNLQKTRLGWIIAGGMGPYNKQVQSINCHAIVNNDDIDLDKSITRFWQIEEINKKPIKTQADEYCENHFKQNFKRSSNGQFIVKIPFKENIVNLGQSQESARNRFYSQERRLIKNKQLQAQYVNFMTEYIELGHMSEVESASVVYPDYFIPHHAVIRESSLTSKIRIVYDASMKTDSGLSLNETQYVGPTIQNDLISIFLRFRKHNFVMTADISKMYRMVLIDPEQRKFQKIFWRNHPHENLKCYQLNTVSYGTASAPWLAIRSLYELAIENEEANPIASSVIKNDFYVDDLLTGCSSRSQLIQLQHDITNILKSGGFILRKWLSNDNEIYPEFCIKDNIDVSVLSIGNNETNKTLGVLWNPTGDTIQFSVGNLENQRVITKRTILSTIAQVYDPIGLLGPIVVVAKLLIQKLWQAKISWDESVPQSIHTAWLQFCNELPSINNIKFSRQILLPDYDYVELHVFADASEKAYGTCLYVRSKNQSGNCLSRLLVAKSRVAPLKKVTLPRLELCAALLAAQLTQKVLESIDLQFNKVYYWSDSTITLCWLQASPAKWKTFVANRVSEIQQLTNVKKWHHVPSKQNPADLISRGTTVQALRNDTLWFTGPDWLSDPQFKIQPNNFDLQSIDIPEQRVISNFVATINDLNIFQRYSSARKLRRVVAYIFRFLFNCKNNHVKKTGFLDCEELENSTNVLIQLAQQESFPQEYHQLKNNKPLNKKSNLLNLSPFIDDKQLMRVGGRMQNSAYPYDKRHPIILSSKHIFTKLILKEEHEKLLHCGPTMLLSSIRERYWPVHGRNLAKSVVFNCVKCFKVNPRSTPQYIMGNLPESRINQFTPFFHTGCDFAGPFLLKDKITRDTRGSKLVKGYVCLFICLSTKAVHLEAVSDLSTESFLATFRRFIGRRGKPLHMYTDNALNFVGANTEIKKLYNFLEDKEKTINDNLSADGITWHFAPPRSPNFGGIWEAGIKSAKFHLKRVIGEAHLNLEDFNTVLIQIESILNSRPLCPLPSVPDQLNPLTPSHFIMGKAATSLPDRDYIEIPENRLKRFERLQRMIQHFWSRWSLEYLCELQSRNKWKTNAVNFIKVGTIVLIKEDNLPPLQWRMGRVIELHPGKDGVTRVASVAVNNSLVLKRALSKLCPFPCETQL